MQKLSFEKEISIKRLQFSPFIGQNDVPIKYSGAPTNLEHNDISFLHYHNETEIGYCIEGTGTCVISNKIFTFSSGDYFLIAPNVPHYHKTISESDCICDFIFFDFDKIISALKISFVENIPFLNTNISSKIIRSKSSEELINPLKDIMKIATNYDNSLNLSEFLICFLLLAERLKKIGSPFEFSKTNLQEQKLTPAINMITANYTTNIDIEALAEACHMSKSHFMKEFNNTFGISAYAFLNRFRVYAAKEMLAHTDYSASYISEVCGFNSFSNFFRQFKKYFDISPSDFRRQQKTLNI